jgi:hypothetical protein
MLLLANIFRIGSPVNPELLDVALNQYKNRQMMQLKQCYLHRSQRGAYFNTHLHPRELAYWFGRNPCSAWVVAGKKYPV